MNFFIIALLLLFILLSSKVECVVEKRDIDDALKYLTLDREKLDKIRNIHRNWYLFAIKALLSQMAKEILTKANNENGMKLKECLRRIKHCKDITETAGCLVKAKESLDEHPLTTRFESHAKKRKKKIWRKNFLRPGVVRLKGKRRRQSNISVKLMKHKKRRRRRLRRSPHRLVISRFYKSSRDLSEIKTQPVAPALLESPRTSPIHRLSDLFVSLFSNVSLSNTPTRWSVTYKKILQLNQKMEENKKMPGTQVYNRRIYDIVMDTKQADKDIYEPVIPGFLKNIVAVVKSFSNAGNSRVLSPRFAPLLPDKASSNGFLSPSFFPFYKDDTERQILPIPQMLEDSGLNSKDRERVVETIMELSGTRETVDNAMKVLDHLSALGFGEKLLSVSDKIYDSFERLQSSLSDNQSDDLKRRGFTFMKAEQMKKLHREQGLKEPQVDAQTEEYGRLSKSDREKALWETIAQLAGLRYKRSKRQILPTSVLSPIVLSPYQFAPVFGLGVLGPVVLSPNIFSPLILNPAVLGPWVLSPSFPLPFILSPYLLSPYVLSPLVMAPFVLSPYMLSPNVINPYVLSPLILSPLMLCPDILSPMVLGGAILSPSVLSPGVLSKSFLMASVLSPTFLS